MSSPARSQPVTRHVMRLEPAGPLDVVAIMRAERAAFLELLRSLSAPEWDEPTECPSYDVRGVAAHLVGDDLSLLSRQRDNATPGLLRFFQDGGDFRSALDQFNDTWVGAAQFFSATVLVDLLELTGRWTADWYAAVDPESLGEPVGFFGATGPSPYWQIAAREYVERWVHHHQIRRALGRADLDDATYLLPAVAAVVRAVASHLRDIGVAEGCSVGLSVEGLAAWTLERTDNGWVLFDGRTDDATAEVTLARTSATPVLSRGVARDAVREEFWVAGDAEIGRRLLAAIAALAGR